MPKQEVPLPNIFQYSTVIWWKTVYMPHMSFKGHKRKLTMSGCSEWEYVCGWNNHRTILFKKLKQIWIAQQIVFEKIMIMHKGQQRKIRGVQYAMYL